jgi:hypothetical protein
MCKYSYLVKGERMLSDSADGYEMSWDFEGGVTEPVIARIAGEALMPLKTAEMEK